jgi:hypothetical protein
LKKQYDMLYEKSKKQCEELNKQQRAYPTVYPQVYPQTTYATAPAYVSTHSYVAPKETVTEYVAPT